MVLRTELSDRTFEIISQNVQRDIHRSQEAILMVTIFGKRMKMVIEPSSAVPLAVLILNKFLSKENELAY